MALLFVRHGETALNAARVLQPADTALSARGHRQADALAQRLARWPEPGIAIAGVLSSDLPRALQTAQPIADGLGLAVRADAGFRERDFGELRGRPYDSLGYDPIAQPEAPPGGESMAQFEARVADAFARLLVWSRDLTGDALVVTHGLVLRVLAERHFTGEARAVLRSAGNTSLTIVEADAPYRLRLVGCLAHLPQEPLEAGGPTPIVGV